MRILLVSIFGEISTNPNPPYFREPCLMYPPYSKTWKKEDRFENSTNSTEKGVRVITTSYDRCHPSEISGFFKLTFHGD